MFSCEFRVPSHISKKNNRPIWGKRPGKSKRLVAMEQYMEIMFRRAYKKSEPLKPPYHLKMTFVFGNNKKREYAICDLSNLIELPQDCLQKAGVIENDRFVMSFDGTRKVRGEGTLLRVEVLPYSDELEGKK